MLYNFFILIVFNQYKRTSQVRFFYVHPTVFFRFSSGSLQVSSLNAEIESIDPEAFVVMNAVKETRGGIIKKRPLQH